MNGTKKVALLDVDGTLIDSNDAHAQSWVETFAEFGHEVSFNRVRDLIGKGGDKLMHEAIGVEEDTPLGEEIAKRRGAIFEKTSLPRVRAFDGGLLGQWAVWTRSAVTLLERCKAARAARTVDESLLREGTALTDANAAIFDAANSFAGCIPGIHEVLRRQGLLAGVWCLDTAEKLSTGQEAEIDRVCRSHPSLADDAFVRDHLESWLRP